MNSDDQKSFFFCKNNKKCFLTGEKYLFVNYTPPADDG